MLQSSLSAMQGLVHITVKMPEIRGLKKLDRVAVDVAECRESRQGHSESLKLLDRVIFRSA